MIYKYIIYTWIRYIYYLLLRRYICSTWAKNWKWNLNWKRRDSSNPLSYYDNCVTGNIYYKYSPPTQSPKYIYIYKYPINPPYRINTTHTEKFPDCRNLKIKKGATRKMSCDFILVVHLNVYQVYFAVGFGYAQCPSITVSPNAGNNEKRKIKNRKVTRSHKIEEI